jgi:glycosyltransferase involved in cell wall biosynthesis
LRVLIDASGADSGGLATVAASLIGAWGTADEAAADELHVVATSLFLKRASIQMQDCYTHAIEPGLVGRLGAQYWLVQSVAKRVGPDVLLATLPIVPLGRIRCPIVVICYDLRHELRPSEFGPIRRLARAIEYRRAYQRASKIIAISRRTASDLVRHYPGLASKVSVAHLGADHLPPYQGVLPGGPRHALAYAQHSNKRPELAIKAWALMNGLVSDLPVLSVIGASPGKALELRRLCESLDVPATLVTIRGALDESAYLQTLQRSQLLVFPSSFEGFGLPVLEALRNKIPVVVTPDEALKEVGDDQITVATDDSAEALAEAVKLALTRDTADRRAAGAVWAAGFTWRSTAAAIRTILIAAT